MKANIGSTDKIIRLVLAMLLVVLFFTGIIDGTKAIVALIVAGILVGTSLINFCPLYLPFGISTCKKK